MAAWFLGHSRDATLMEEVLRAIGGRAVEEGTNAVVADSIAPLGRVPDLVRSKRVLPGPAQASEIDTLVVSAEVRAVLIDQVAGDISHPRLVERRPDRHMIRVRPGGRAAGIFRAGRAVEA